jgi:hypothetical protein
MSPVTKLVTGTALISALMFASCAVFAEGGYGGPDLNAEVIPPAFNGISGHDLVAALHVCLVTGDNQREIKIKSLDQRILELFYPNDPSRLEILESLKDPSIMAREEMTLNDLIAREKSQGPHKLSVFPRIENSDLYTPVEISRSPFGQYATLAGVSGKPSYFYMVNDNIPANNVVSNYESAAQFLIEYSEAQQARTFDQFRNITSQNVVFNGLVVRASANRARFVNSDTNQTLDLTISLKEAEQCIRKELQRAAK